jgi:2-polyprenyl-3-methyl-5-hydroxy-6-metoxy-1,4-benzoquinol methylase
VSSAALDYFANHVRAHRFPWSLYHRPIERDLVAFLAGVTAAEQSIDILVIGCGLLHEADRIPLTARLHVVDIDRRAIDAVLRQGHEHLASATVLHPDQRLSTLGRAFDAVYAKEVIEHILDPEAYLADVRSVLRMGGGLWLSTPNYGEPWLPLVESTFLEVVARYSGYTRHGIHPSRFSRTSLRRALEKSGFTSIQVRTVAARLALVAHAVAV